MNLVAFGSRMFKNPPSVSESVMTNLRPIFPHFASPKSVRREALQLLLKSILIIAVLSLAGCATLPRPDFQQSQAQQAIAAAVASNAEEDAPVELRFAREQQTQADGWLAKQKHREAGEAFERAQVHAELAEIKAKTLQANQTLGRTQRELDALKLQLEEARQGLGGSAKRKGQR